MITSALLPLLVYAASGPAGATARETCSTVDYADQLGPVWNQRRTSWCHAFTTSDVLTKHLIKKGYLKSGERVHPLQVAAAAPIFSDASVVQSINVSGTMGDDMDALNNAQVTTGDGATPRRLNRGLCLESDLTAQRIRAEGVFNEEFKVAQRMFQGTGCLPKNERLVRPCPPRAEKGFDPLCREVAVSEMKKWLHDFEQKCRRPWPKWHVSTMYNDKRWQRVVHGQRLYPGSAADDQQMRSEIDRALDSDELAAIGYDASFIQKKPGRDESHWSSVVGRARGLDGRCYYKVRNSWGTDCKKYRLSVNCKSGYLTISADDLVARVHSVHYFDK